MSRSCTRGLVAVQRTMNISTEGTCKLEPKSTYTRPIETRGIGTRPAVDIGLVPALPCCNIWCSCSIGATVSCVRLLRCCIASNGC